MLDSLYDGADGTQVVISRALRVVCCLVRSEQAGVTGPELQMVSDAHCCCIMLGTLLVPSPAK